MATLNGNTRRRTQNGTPLKQANGILNKQLNASSIQAGKNDVALTPNDDSRSSANTLNLLICVGGIYASFLTWGLLQERITTTNYAPSPQSQHPREIFAFPVVMNTMQSFCAALLGYLYVLISRDRRKPNDLPIYPSTRIVWPLLLVAATSALSSPFGYASLTHVDYLTFILAKSCKLLPVMFLHVTLYGKRYPFYKYAVVALVTAGVAVFTLHNSSAKKKKGGVEGGSSLYGLMLLGINLLFDGLVNSTQDDIYARFRPYTGGQMMCALNVMSTGITVMYLLLSPYLAQTGLGQYVGMDVTKSAGELWDALGFVRRHPSAGWDVVGFAICGGLGQVFIFRTLSLFGSLLLVTVTVTRKMLTMILSVLWFGHRLSGMQWLGVALVFGGVGVEAELSKREKKAKEAGKKKS
ncbi:UDP-galactose transporter [Friedmanniomyces endolithicus]|uniref:UDP-galactose transporter homolog 1 n=2 Tax=Friedmanniomyces endolithicus TaxID=329885 RepID=A0AAN6FYM6_9PEZI|nr:UDP-galactose transporter [Friedmanniomyces endolithicus]KAK0285249.1 UDP-galactose transporter [Friedmanniomyces endolithicus]KAK0313041.1 UDP-galactose transporter [Friedmanniomyces endolithicus]KAK0326841.1 UDP-galactose transporter [Friedmanniomyces endolithicus]KAK0828847.1 UDP-galactose transporter [Friedmanniomyces endolithicus]